MKKPAITKLLLLVPALWTSLFDSVITIVHQPREYWDGNLYLANEANPIGELVMKYHITGIFVLCALWLVAIGGVAYHLPTKLSRIFLLFVIIVHAYGASSWLNMIYGFWYVLVFVLFTVVLFYWVQDCVDSKISNKETDN
ncbi:hypothetical protein [Labilibaculum sp.]|uniref:hypothetical protein n=1 Tax=Labilibaculum sp. TaxID=2060723 RepID=UPI0035653D8D